MRTLQSDDKERRTLPQFSSLESIISEIRSKASARSESIRMMNGGGWGIVFIFVSFFFGSYCFFSILSFK